jgi:peptide/nickel transport system permease protein
VAGSACAGSSEPPARRGSTGEPGVSPCFANLLITGQSQSDNAGTVPRYALTHPVATTERPELVSSGAGLASTVAAESHGELGTERAVRARGYWEGVFLRFRRDKFAIVGGIYVVLLVVVGFIGAPIAAHFLGHGPNDQFAGGLDPQTVLPVGPLADVSTQPYPGAVGNFQHTFFVLGADGQLGRDEFLRLLYGTQTSLEVAVGATLMAMVIGVLMGALAGFYSGMTDTVISRMTEIVMAFPVLLFVIALASTAGERLNGVTFGFLSPGVVTLIFVLGIFGWFYPARIVRAQVLSLREKEFVEAARMIGTNDWKIIRSHILPHLVAPIIVYSTLVVATNILAEAGLSFLGLGIQQPTASWGNLLATAPDYYLTQPWLMVWPGVAVLLATLAFNLLGDGLRDAFDPRSSG